MAAVDEVAIVGQAIKVRDENYKLDTLFGDYGPLSRSEYKKHTEFFAAGAVRRSRAFLAGNKVGKSTSGVFESTLHLTGDYPDWWIGKRFARAIKAWAAGVSNSKVRDSLQTEFLGNLIRDPANPGGMHNLGSGMIPRAAIVGQPRPKAGVTDAIDSVHVRHASGGISTLLFKSYESGVVSFSAENVDVIELDEEPEQEILTECLMRTMVCNGIIMITATPLLGMTPLMIELVDAYRTQVPLHEPSPRTYVVMAGWDDAPHLDAQAKTELEKNIPPYQRDSRIRGIPQLGSGAIYPIDPHDIEVEPFPIPDFWPRSWALDVGNNTACVWGTQNRETGVYYLYREYFRSGDEEAVPPSIHSQAILGHRRKDQWMPGVVDPAARGRSQTDGRRLIEMYKDLGLELTGSQNAVESGIQEVLDAFNTGKLKVFKDVLPRWWEEFRLYRRDKNGRIVKLRDHLMDATRYWWLSGREAMRTRPVPTQSGDGGGHYTGDGSWMA